MGAIRVKIARYFVIFFCSLVQRCFILGVPNASLSPPLISLQAENVFSFIAVQMCCFVVVLPHFRGDRDVKVSPRNHH